MKKADLILKMAEKDYSVERIAKILDISVNQVLRIVYKDAEKKNNDSQR